MPELPEVDAIVGVARRHAIRATLSHVEVIRQNGKYFQDGLPAVGRRIYSVERVGKYVVILFETGPDVVIHNAMTGYLDWEHEPWTFDYVEGPRSAGESDVRVRFTFKDGKVLRFHDARLFGFMFQSDLGAPVHGPELMDTPNAAPRLNVITLREFARGVCSSRIPIKVLLMDQDFLSGIGNIYSSEACHLAGIDPRISGNQIDPRMVPILLESLRLVVSHSIPKVKYDWLKVYRRATCGDCDNEVLRVELSGRATFLCESCQT